MPTVTAFGKRLAKLRELRQLTQDQLSQKAEIPAAVISHFETGVRSSASADNLVKLANALRVSIDYLLGRTDDMTPASSDLQRRAAELTDDELNMLQSLADTLARSRKRDPGRVK